MYLTKTRSNTKKLTKVNKVNVNKLTLLSKSWKFNKNHPIQIVKRQLMISNNFYAHIQRTLIQHILQLFRTD